MQAGLTTRRLMFREIFSSTMHFWALRNVTFVFFDSALLVDVNHSRLSMAASQHWMPEAPAGSQVRISKKLRAPKRPGAYCSRAATGSMDFREPRVAPSCDFFTRS
jgi:hypothetical protein